MKKSKLNIMLCFVMIVVVAVCTFCGYLLAENINLNNRAEAQDTETTSKRYEAFGRICVSSPGQNTNRNPDASSPLAENASVIFRYSQEIRSIIPTGYSLSVESEKDTNILKVIICGADPDKSVSTVNNII